MPVWSKNEESDEARLINLSRSCCWNDEFVRKPSRNSERKHQWAEVFNSDAVVYRSKAWHRHHSNWFLHWMLIWCFRENHSDHRGGKDRDSNRSLSSRDSSWVRLEKNEVTDRAKERERLVPEVIDQLFAGASKTCSRNRRNDAVKSTFKSSQGSNGGYQTRVETTRRSETSSHTFATRDIVESDSSVDEDCPPTLLISPQIIGLLLV